MNTPSDILNYLHRQGERLTLSRRLVIEALGQSHQHLTISAVQQHIQADDPRHALSDTTVYRVLQWLKELGLVSQTDMGQAGIVYALITTPCHHHLICLSCGTTITLEDSLFATLRDQLQQSYGFETRIDHMALYGTCRNCLQQ